MENQALHFPCSLLLWFEWLHSWPSQNIPSTASVWPSNWSNSKPVINFNVSHFGSGNRKFWVSFHLFVGSNISFAIYFPDPLEFWQVRGQGQGQVQVRAKITRCSLKSGLSSSWLRTDSPGSKRNISQISVWNFRVPSCPDQHWILVGFNLVGLINLLSVKKKQAPVCVLSVPISNTCSILNVKGDLLWDRHLCFFFSVTDQREQMSSNGTSILALS